jgi:hypothetical protein
VRSIDNQFETLKTSRRYSKIAKSDKKRTFNRFAENSIVSNPFSSGLRRLFCRVLLNVQRRSAMPH